LLAVGETDAPGDRVEDVEEEVAVTSGQVTPSLSTTCICLIQTGEGLSLSSVVIVYGTPLSEG
jgi:hypothetical protein